MMDPFDWKQDYETSGGIMSLDDFLAAHGEHDILICDEGPTEADDLRRRCGGHALVEYLGEESPHYLNNDGLFFVVKPMTTRGLPRKKSEPIHIVVYVQ